MYSITGSSVECSFVLHADTYDEARAMASEFIASQRFGAIVIFDADGVDVEWAKLQEKVN